MSDRRLHETIHTIDRPECILCGSKGERLYDRMEDRLFDAPGIWTLKRCINRECDLIWLDPMPSEADIGKAYRTYYTHNPHCQDRERVSLLRRFYHHAIKGYQSLRYGYHKGIHLLQKLSGILIYLRPLRRIYLNFDMFYLSAQPGGSFLEVGCGNGTMLERMKSLGWQVEGVDLDLQAVDLARQRGLNVHGGTLQSRNYPDACFDAIGMMHLIEHVHDPLALLRECYRILKPGGRLVVVTPNMKSRGHVKFKESYLHLDPPRHLHLFNAGNLRRALAATGFAVDSLKTTARDANGVYQAYHAIKARGKYIMGSFESDKMRRLASLYQAYEWFLLKFKPRCGEEIVLAAKK